MNQKGISLIIVLIIAITLSLLASGLFVITTSDTFTARNYKFSKEAFYAAEAGMRYGEKELRQLKSIALVNGIYRSNSSDILGPKFAGKRLGKYFVQPSSVTNPDHPESGVILKNVQFDSTDSMRRFSVLIANNDPNEKDASGKLAEIDNKLYLRSIGYGPGNSKVVLEEMVEINSVTVDTTKDQALSSATGQDKFNR